MIEIVYQDEWLIVLNKPSGLLSVPGRGADKQDCLSRRVQHQIPAARVVHRLDRDTSGIMLMAKTAHGQRQLSQLFENRQVEKQYVAVVEGHLQPNTGQVDLPLAKDFSRPPRHRVDRQHGRPALTRWQVDQLRSTTTRCLLYPQTGRSHQLRVHLSEIGHPIVNDPLYGSRPEHEVRGRLMLHAESLTFPHPATGQPLHVCQPAPF